MIAVYSRAVSVLMITLLIFISGCVSDEPVETVVQDARFPTTLTDSNYWKVYTDADRPTVILFMTQNEYKEWYGQAVRWHRKLGDKVHIVTCDLSPENSATRTLQVASWVRKMTPRFPTIAGHGLEGRDLHRIFTLSNASTSPFDVEAKMASLFFKQDVAAFRSEYGLTVAH